VRETAASSAPAAFCVGVSKGFITATRNGALLNLRVSPGANRTSIEGPYGESAFRLKVAVPPLSGKANAEAERFLSKLLGVRCSDVALVRGASSRDERILVRGVEEETALKALAINLS
jgi:uncharacterized protein (TIGR00251 family)